MSGLETDCTDPLPAPAAPYDLVGGEDGDTDTQHGNANAEAEEMNAQEQRPEGEPEERGSWFPIPHGEGGAEKQEHVRLEAQDWDTSVGLWDAAGIAGERDEASYFRFSHAPGDESEPQTPLMAEEGKLWSSRSFASSFAEHNDDYFTVDWAAYAHKDRERRHRLAGEHADLPGIERWLREGWEVTQSWVALLLIGFMTGAVAATVGVGVDFFSEIRLGTCHQHGFWVSRGICCKGAGPDCEDWWPWSRVLLKQGAWVGWEWGVDFGSYVLLSLLEAGTASWLVLAMAPYAAGSGISEVKVVLGGFVIKRLLGAWVLVVKAVGLMLSVGSGMMVGKEGPFVHIACCLANILARLFPRYRDNEAKKRELLSSAAAAGVAVAFGAPVGGVLFSLEEVSSYFPAKTLWRSILCAIIAVTTIQGLLPINHNKTVMFEVSFHHAWHLFEVLPFALLGALGGLAGALFIHANPRICQGRKQSWTGRWPITWVLVTCLVTCVLHYPVEILRGSKIALLQMLFSDCRGPAPPAALCSLAQTPAQVVLVLVCAAALELSLSVLTFGLKLPGGLFVPSLTVGALLGRAVGNVMQLLRGEVGDGGVFEECVHFSTCVNPAIYAIVGAAAVLGGVTRMTVSLVVIVIEVTNGMQYVIPVMIAIMVSKWVGDAFGPDSIYVAHIRLNAYPLLESHEDLTGSERAVEALQTRSLQVLTMAGETLGSVKDTLSACSYRGFPVVTDRREMLVVGYMPRRVLERLVLKLEEQRPPVPRHVRCLLSKTRPPSGSFLDLSGHLDAAPGLVFHSTPLPSVVEMFRAVGLRYLLVTKDGQLIGIIKKKDVLEYLELRGRASNLNPLASDPDGEDDAGPDSPRQVT